MARLKGPSASLCRATARAIGPGLTQLPNVTHISIGEKITGGRRTQRRALKVYVQTKSDDPTLGEIPPAIPVLNKLGRKVGELATDIVEVAEVPRLFGIRSGHSLLAFDRDLGVVGLSFEKAGRRYILTNAHVACDLARGGVSGDMAWRLGATATRLGPVVYASRMLGVPMATEDLAIIHVDRNVAVDPYWLDLVNVRVDRADDLRQNGREHWFVAHGRLYRCANAEPIDTPTVVSVDGIQLTYGRFWQFGIVQGDPQPGISGALLCRTVGRRFVACGLVFAGVPGQFVWAFPFRTAFDRQFARL